MFGIGFTRELERTIATRDNSIKLMKEEKTSLEDKILEESLKVVRLAAENATLKQRINNLESDVIKASEVCSSFAVQYEVLEKEIRAYKVLEANMNKTISLPKLEKAGTIKVKSDKPVNAKLQAYYNRGKKSK